MANVVGKILKTEDFDFTDEQDTNACEQILDRFLEFTSETEPATSSSSSNNDNTILDTAWEETFGDLFPDLGECTFWRIARVWFSTNISFVLYVFHVLKLYVLKKYKILKKIKNILVLLFSLND